MRKAGKARESGGQVAGRKERVVQREARKFGGRATEEEIWRVGRVRVRPVNARSNHHRHAGERETGLCLLLFAGRMDWPIAQCVGIRWSVQGHMWDPIIGNRAQICPVMPTEGGVEIAGSTPYKPIAFRCHFTNKRAQLCTKAGWSCTTRNKKMPKSGFV